MDGKDIRSDREEPYLTDNSDESSFFKKYKLVGPQEGESVDHPIFKKYVLVREGEDANQRDRLDLEDKNSFDAPDVNKPTKQRPWQGTTLLLWAAVAVAALLLGGWIVFYELVRTGQPEANQHSSGEEPAADRGDKVSASAGPQIPQESDSQSEESLDENILVPVGLRRPSTALSGMLLNAMLARARVYEDRGMLVRAEEEYRAAVSSFPEDKLSQNGLKRVQNALSQKQKNEMSTVSRETGLKEFRMSDFAAAERHLSAAVDAGRSDTATLYALGMSYLKLGSFTQAQRALENCMAGNPEYAPALVGLAQVNAAIGRKQEALPLLQRALELGGGAEFTPAKIKEMIFVLSPEQSAPIDSKSPQPAVQRSQPTFYANAIHAHDLVLSSCRGELSIVNSVVHFNGSNPDHSLHILRSEVTGAHIKGKELQFNANGKFYRFNLNGRSPQDFLNALGR
jgi:tetratricopeptide (TPR) repeat protein